MTSAKLSIICVDEEKKESVETRKRLLWEMKLIECSVLNKLTLLTYQYETKQEEG